MKHETRTHGVSTPPTYHAGGNPTLKRRWNMQEHNHPHVAGNADDNSRQPTNRGIRSRLFFFADPVGTMLVIPHVSHLSLGGSSLPWASHQASEKPPDRLSWISPDDDDFRHRVMAFRSTSPSHDRCR